MFNKKKRFFKHQIKGNLHKVWVIEFSIYKKMQLREAIRQEYGLMKSRLEPLEAKIASEIATPIMTVDDRKRLEDQRDLINRDLTKLMEQIDNLDLEINGCKPNEKHQEGVQGEMQVLDTYRTLIQSLKDYIKNVL